MQTSGVGDNIRLIDETPSVSSINSSNAVITARFATGNSVASVFCQIGDDDPFFCDGSGKFNGG